MRVFDHLIDSYPRQRYEPNDVEVANIGNLIYPRLIECIAHSSELPILATYPSLSTL